MSEISRHQRVAIFGNVRSGKSSLAARLFFAHAAPRICIDVKDDRGPLMPNVPTVTNASEVGDYWTVRAVPTETADADWYEEIFEIALRNGDTLVWLDEANEVSRSNFIPRKMRNFILQGEGKGCGYIACTPRPADVSPTVYNQSSHIFVFNVEGERDYIAVANNIGIPRRELEKTMRELPKYHYLHYDREDRVVTVNPPLSDPDELTRQIAQMRFGRIGE